jgi:hypothetical protein
MHWHTAKLHEYCSKGLIDTEVADQTSVNSLFFKLDTLAEVLDQSACLCQDAMDCPLSPTPSDVARFVAGTGEDVEDPTVDVSP